MEATQILYDPLVLNLIAKQSINLYEIMRKFNLSCHSAQCILKRLEDQEAVASQHIGRCRVFNITPEGRSILRMKSAQLKMLVKPLEA